ncbi:MAG: anti-sigma factor [Candidatus Thiodiazotropha sp.]
MMPDKESEELTILAGEYVLGTLEGEQRVEFERRMQTDMQLRDEVDAWQQRMAPMLDTVDPVTPPKAVWDQISRRIEPTEHNPPERSGFWNSLSFWRNLGMATASLVLVLGMTLLTTRQQQVVEMESIMVVLNDQSRPGWLVGAPAHERFLKVKAVEPTPMPTGKVCQLWMEDEQGHLYPLGLLPHDGSEQMELPTALGSENRFKVSIEQLNQLPKDKPSTEIVFEGSLTEI